MSRLLLFVFVALFSLAQVQAWTIPLAGLGTSPPPSILLTTDISPQCEAVNNGTLLCCETTVAGGVPAVQLAAQLAGYELPANTLNGVLCEKSTGTCETDDARLCCQVITLYPAWALWCQAV